MALGTGGANLSNLPSGVTYQVNPALFNQLTTKQKQPVASFNLPQPANFVTTTLLKDGIVSRLRLCIRGSFTGGGTIDTDNFATATVFWPYGILSNVSLTGNGLNNFFNCGSWDLYLLQLMNYKSINDTYTVPGLAVGSNVTVSTTAFQVMIEIPVAMDQTTLVGALYAQSDVTNLTLSITTNAMANLFAMTAASGAPTATIVLADAQGVVPNVTVEETIFSVPYHTSNKGQIVIPDLTVLHGFVSNLTAVSGGNTVTQKLLRISGQMERCIFYESFGPDLPVRTDYTSALLLYGASDNPLNFNPIDLLIYQNIEDNRNALPSGVFCIDNVAENAQRDQMLIQALTELRLTVNHNSGAYTPNAAEQLIVLQELLYA